MNRQYPIVCPSCNGSGWINNPTPVSSSTQVICPACNGSKTVIATENDIFFEETIVNIVEKNVLCNGKLRDTIKKVKL